MKFIANLNGIILCPYQILLDISEQIPNCPPRLKSMAFMPICELNSTNDWINLESLGKPVALRAKAICDVLSILLQKQKVHALKLEIYLGRSPLSSDNLFSLLYLSQCLQSLEITFFTDVDSQSALADKTEVLGANENLSITYRTDNNLIEINTLTQLKETRDHTIKQLGFQFEEDFLAKNELPEATLNQIIGFSWMCLKAGAYDIACRLLEKTKLHKNNSAAMQEQLFMHLLMIRFFSHQYALITESEFPRQFIALAESEVKTLQFLKAYSATLSRNLAVAQEFFKECNINAQMPLSDETSLYQLNLFALSRVLLGETETAFELEFRIRDYIAAQQIETVGLKYVNFINIARLYKKSKDYDQALEYYNKAYNEISGGGYATSDHIYYNMNLGSLFEAAGNHEKALGNWVKAALHWLACKNKYELSWRPRLILCGETLADIAKPLPIDKANTFLLHKIKELIHLSGIHLTSKAIPAYRFCDDSVAAIKEHTFVRNNILLYTAALETSNASHQVSSTELNLANLLSQYLHTVMDIPEGQNTFIVDTHWDAMALNKPEEAFAYAQLSNCQSCYFNGAWLQPEQFKALKPMKASLSKVIQSITETEKGLSLSYKRSFLNKTLMDQEEINWVNLINNPDGFSLVNITSTDWNVVHQLAKKRIVNFSYPL